jgi:hypothetical protein
MQVRDGVIAAGLLGLAGAATLAYGSLVETKRLTLEEVTLRLSGWPVRLEGYRIAVLGDLHVQDPWSLEVAERAIEMALGAQPDMVVLVGDLVTYWRPDLPATLGRLLEPLLLMEGRVVAVPGNHEYSCGTPDPLAMICAELNIRLLRNENVRRDGISWVGVDSFNAGMADPILAMQGAEAPAICLWHEPDLVRFLPPGCVLQISGHSHGGQFIFPGGWTPKHSTNGRRYVRGFYPHAPTPLYVTRGVGCTFLPSRLNCPPEVSLLTLVPEL